MFNLMGFALNPFYRQGGRFRAFLMFLLLGVGEPVPSGLSKVPPGRRLGIFTVEHSTRKVTTGFYEKRYFSQLFGVLKGRSDSWSR